MKKNESDLVCGCGCGFRTRNKPLFRLHEIIERVELKQKEEQEQKQKLPKELVAVPPDGGE